MTVKGFTADSHNGRLLQILSDGEWHSSAEILAESIARWGEGMTVHSRVSNLDANGYGIERDKVPGRACASAFLYRLVSSPVAGNGSTAKPPGQAPLRPALSFCTLCAHELLEGEPASEHGAGFAHDRCIGLADGEQLSLASEKAA